MASLRDPGFIGFKLINHALNELPPSSTVATEIATVLEPSIAFSLRIHRGHDRDHGRSFASPRLVSAVEATTAPPEGDKILPVELRGTRLFTRGRGDPGAVAVGPARHRLPRHARNPQIRPRPLRGGPMLTWGCRPFGVGIWLDERVAVRPGVLHRLGDIVARSITSRLLILILKAEGAAFRRSSRWVLRLIFILLGAALVSRRVFFIFGALLWTAVSQVRRLPGAKRRTSSRERLHSAPCGESRRSPTVLSAIGCSTVTAGTLPDAPVRASCWLWLRGT